MPKWAIAAIATVSLVAPGIWWEAEQSNTVDNLTIEMEESKQDNACDKCLRDCDRQCDITKQVPCPCWEVCARYCDK